MPLVKEDRLIKKVTEMARSAVSGTGRALGIKPKTPPGSLAWHLRDFQVRKALQVIIGTLDDRHRQQLMDDLGTMHISPLSRYVVYTAFLEKVSPPVRPLALHPELGDWLLALPIEETRYYPADPCWQCGYRYPGTAVLGCATLGSATPGSATPGSASPACRSILPAPSNNDDAPGHDSTLRIPSSTLPPHPWAGRECLYCRGEIVNHLAWLGPDATRSLSDFQNAPYRIKQQSMARHWSRDLDNVEPFIVPPSARGSQISSD